ncbi:hypothetical protein JB92DRAFT_2827382 [Gautieria morchelliformis]|nr:hypothetical protein JB92DRAFT_2827382 [Gautieria morchelliformis]
MALFLSNLPSDNCNEGNKTSSLRIRTADNTKLSGQDGAYAGSRQPRQGQAADNTNLSQKQDDSVQSRYPRQRQRSGSMDMRHNGQYSDRRGSRMQRRSLPLENEYEEEAELNEEKEEEEEEEEWDAIDDDSDATKTSLRLRRPDPPLAPRGPRLPPSLTMLEQKIYIDTPTDELVEQQGGDYVRYFSPKEWSIVRTQSSAPLSVVDYARLALHLNRTVPVSQRTEGVEIVRKHVEKAKVIATAP